MRGQLSPGPESGLLRTYLNEGDTMATITIRNVPEKLRDSLQLRAKTRGQSLEQFLREFLVTSFSRQHALQRIDDRRARLPKVNVKDLLQRDDDGRYQ